MVDFKFPKTKRLLKRRDFLEVQAKGEKLYSRLFTLYFYKLKPSSLDEVLPLNLESKVGITVSKKVSKHSHERNLIRRRIREIFRVEILPQIQHSTKFVIIAKNSALSASFSEYKEDIIVMLKRRKGMFK